MLQNHVRSLRLQNHLSQTELAVAASVTRQTIAAIEMAQVAPSITVALRLARILGVAVEELFQETISSSTEVAHLGPDEPVAPGERVTLGRIGDRWIAHAATEMLGQRMQPSVAHGVVLTCNGSSVARIQRNPSGAQDPAVFIAGCDIGLGLLAEHARSGSGTTETIWHNADNRAALTRLSQGLVHMAAIHGDTKIAVQAQATSLLSTLQGYRQIQFARWEIGWLVKRGNPAHFETAADLASGHLRIVNRATGAGARRVLDTLLQEAHVASDMVSGYGTEVAGHLQVADAIVSGHADVGIGISSAAAIARLDFIPIQEETCTLLVPDTVAHDDGVKRVLSLLQSDRFRWDLARFGPYDVTATGAFI